MYLLWLDTDNSGILHCLLINIIQSKSNVKLFPFQHYKPPDKDGSQLHPACKQGKGKKPHRNSLAQS